MTTPLSLAQEMAAFGVSPDVQLAQTAMRMRLVDAWEIPAGARVLEVGCGQGDLTAVLAAAVGPEGSVVAIDRAGPDYGSPVTIGESLAHLKSGRFGEVIEFHLSCDLRSAPEHLAKTPFDFIVLAHCSWYFDSLDLLGSVLRGARDWAPRLCLSEWDLTPTAAGQFAHLLAALLRGRLEAHKEGSQANIRCPYAMPTLQNLLEGTGWHELACVPIDCSELLDGRWEVDDCLGLDAGDAPLLESELAVLRSVAARFGTESLHSFALQAQSR